MRTHVERVALLGLLLAASACGPSDAPGVTTTDSAGVLITLSTDTLRVFAVVDSLPLLSLGGPDAAGPTQFGNVSGARVDRRGYLWVADGQAAEVRIFQPDGSFWKSLGGRGEGPGEFMRIRLLGSFRGDSVAVWDDAQGRLTVLDPQGELARVTTAQGGDAYPPNAFRVFHDGTVLARVRKILQAGALEPGTLIPDTAVFARVDYSDMRIQPEGGAPAPRWLWTGRASIPIPFTVNPGFDLSGDEVHTSSGPPFRIRVFRGGALVESYGLDRDPAPVRANDRQDYVDMVMANSGDSPRRQDYLSVLDHPAVPVSLPAYRSLVVAESGEVWAERYTYGSFDVYGTDRVFRGRVDVPMTLTQVTDSTLVGVWRDDFHVEHVRIHGFRRIGR